MTPDQTFLDPASVLAGRGAIHVQPGGVLAVGNHTMSFDPDDATSLLTAHLLLVRKLRKQQREAVVLLRADDITALAELIGESAADVIEKLGSLMGATRAQRSAMATLFAAGALVIGLASSGAVIGHGASKAASASSFSPPTGAAVSLAVEHSPIARPNVLYVDHAGNVSRDARASTGVATPAVDHADIVGATVLLLDPSPAVPASVGTETAVWAPPTVAKPASAPSVGETDPALVDIGTPPVPPVAAVPTDAGATLDPPVLLLEPPLPPAAPTEIISTPTLAVDPPAPGFGG